ncbi:1-acylglycerol-3-phosphate O-acyltransferase [Spizellomyces punctatus DAOM BR117]|uniref:1-acyl-sn-glycerol-3-phosphate acyltransferase n=1 Tax=Spizellomyces punctatus (strain DAOM BR117) TaxID=645134 RepID=A0A0L0HNU1_SPIPD|nr:1-acylglycerol-3-phosphate O-acyltransferase [Spizellomyces punctatus DAOM BR117]KND02494.1 1-acylglycerol-3-phosphate O-acyltransferase [Spizellomyces punctatus DAOM BR117]|eukprot:XP_016610533.1 1-acylglycerol-3-phosphate O-acyltransferase [Spizellomyces punctatus DAOM BR117]
MTKTTRKTETASRLMTLLARPQAPALAAGALIFLILFRRSSRFRFFARMFGFIFTMAISCIVGITVAPVMWLLGKPGLTNYVVARTFALIGPHFCGLKFKVEGKEHLKNTPMPAVFVCNHQSSLDLLAMGAILPKNVVVMGKKSIKYVPLLGWFMALGNNVFIDRKNRGHALETMAKVAVYLKEHKYGLWLFPEGTRSHQTDDSLLPFKKGAFHLAVQGQIPVIPIVFSTYYPCYHQKNQIFEPGVVTIKVLPPIPTTGLETANVDDLLAKTRDTMAEALKGIKTKPTGSVLPPISADSAKKLE